ncbi:hypothetical protein ACF0H5_017355 [Mactra antiquata]
MDREKYRRPPKRDFTTIDISAPSPTLSTLSGTSQKPHDYDTASNIATSRTSGRQNIRFRSEYTGSRAVSPTDSATDETLRCPICNDSMTTPKILPCLHNACKMCLHQHILTELRDNIQNNEIASSFPCPVCRRDTKPPVNDVGCEKWASLFPTNYFLHAYGMILAVQREEVDCEPCLRRGETTLATWWCRECGEYQCNVCKTVHSGFKIFRHHAVVGVKDIASNPDMAIPMFEPCNEHKEKITHFCRDHRVPCCGSCLLTTHRRCDRVVTVDEEFNALKGRGGVQQLLGKLEIYEDTVNDLIETRRSMVEDLESRRQTILDTVKTIREAFEEDLRMLETKLIEDFEKVHKDELEKMRQISTDCENLGKQISNAVKLINKVQQSGNEAHKINLVEKVTRECRSYQVALTEQHRQIKHVDYDFRVDHNIANVLKTASVLGTISVKKTNQKTESIVGASNLSIGEPLEVGQVRVWIATDRGRCGIVGGHYFDDGRILLADCDNFKLKLFGRNGRHLSHIVLKSRPSDLTMIDKHTTAICFPFASGIQIFNLDRNVFKSGDFINTRRIYRSISYRNNYLFMLCDQGIAVCDKEGKEINFLRFKDHGIPAFSQNCSLKATNDGLVITDRDKHTVNFLSFEGALLQAFSVREMQKPYRIGVDGNNRIFVCCRDAVYQFESDGQMTKVLNFDKHGVHNPMFIGFQKFGDKFFMSDEKISNRDIIHIFEWS